MAFWWGINSLIRHAPSAVGVECIPSSAAAAGGAASSARVVASGPSVVNQLSPQNTCTQKHHPTPLRTRPPFIDEALGASLNGIGDSAAWKSRDRLRFLKCSERGGRVGSSSSSLRRFDGRDGEGLWCLTGSAVVWNREESERDGEKGRWEGR